MLVKGPPCDGHVGIEGCLRRLRESLFWPGMTALAKAYMNECDVYKLVQDAPSKEPMILLQYFTATMDQGCGRYLRVGRVESVGCGRLFQQLC